MPASHLHQHTRLADRRFAQRVMHTHGQTSEAINRLAREIAQHAQRHFPVCLVVKVEESAELWIAFQPRAAEEHALAAGILRKVIDRLHLDWAIEQLHIDERRPVRHDDFNRSDAREGALPSRT
jgi:hypothetical protein